MSHPVPSSTEQSEHETLIRLSFYPDSQRKDWLSNGTRDIVATGMSYDETDKMSIASRNAEQKFVQRDGHELQEIGPGQGRLPSSSIASRVSQGRSSGEVVGLSEDDYPSRVPI
eukprot:9491080-Pyramimonas_sp.AAC.1